MDARGHIYQYRHLAVGLGTSFRQEESQLKGDNFCICDCSDFENQGHELLGLTPVHPERQSLTEKCDSTHKRSCVSCKKMLCLFLPYKNWVRCENSGKTLESYRNSFKVFRAYKNSGKI